MLDTKIETSALNIGEPLEVTLKAKPKDCKTLAGRFNWESVKKLEARLKVEAIAPQAYDVTGTISASITQLCRVSGEPISASLNIKVHERFADTPEPPEIDPLAISVEITEDDTIPLGEMIAQLVGIEASPWPRAPRSSDDASVTHSTGEIAHPFASLAEWKEKG